MVGPLNRNLCLSRLARNRRGDYFVDDSGHGGTWTFSSSDVSRFSSAILADLAMRGSSISLMTLARVASLSSSVESFFIHP
jgi:hypothetical protein